MPEYPGESAGEDEVGLVFGPVEKRSRSGPPRRTVIGFVIFFAIAVIVALVATITIVDRPARGPQGEFGIDAFGPSPLAVPGGVRAAFSPDGNRLAAVRGRGSLGLIEGGRFRPIVPDRTVVVGFAWLDDQRVVIREGPVSTGTVVAIGLDATTKGATRLSPDVPPGDGLAASPDRRTLALASSGLATPIGEQATVDLFLATLPEGSTRQLTHTPEVEELHPMFVSDTLLAYSARRGDRMQVEAIDTGSGAVTPLSDAGERAEVIGVVEGRVVWTTGREVFARGPEEKKAERLARVDEGMVPVAIDPMGRRLIVRVMSLDGSDSVLQLLNL